MIRLRVKEETYRKGTNWKEASEEESNVLIASVDLEDDHYCPVEEGAPGQFFFTEEFVCRFYDVESEAYPASKEVENDFDIMEALLAMRLNDPDELRYWFKNVPNGIHILETRWVNRKEGILEFVNTHLEGDPG